MHSFSVGSSKQTFKKGERQPLGLRDALVAPAFAADGHIQLVAADFHLGALVDEVAGRVEAGVDDGLVAAVAGTLYLVDGVGYLKETFRALEEVAGEVGAQAVADDVDAELVHYARELVDLVGREELRLVDEHPVENLAFVGEELAGEAEQVGFGVNPFAAALDAYARADDVAMLACVDNGFEADVAHFAFLEVVCCGQQQGRLCRAHGAVAEIQLAFPVHY